MDSPPQTASIQAPQSILPQEQEQPQDQNMSSPTTTPPSSSPKSFSKRRSASPLSLDLSSLPPLTQPSVPTNTLIITQLNTATIFHPASLATIRQHINTLSPLHSFAPLKSFHRIVCSFYDTESAITVRQHLDGAALLGDVRARVYFGEPTPIGEQKKYLDRPDAGRLFFISPPPSPPVGWEVRDEGPPNKDVYASDLADALGKLSGKIKRLDADGEDESPPEKRDGEAAPLRINVPLSPNGATTASKPGSAGGLGGGASSSRNRSRSSTIIYDPEAHGDSPGLPAVMVEDTTMDSDDEADSDGDVELDDAPPAEDKKIIAHTSRPPVELMNGA